MGRRFAIIDPSEEYFLLISQYLDLGWPDADVEEFSPDDITTDEEVSQSDAIIMCGFDHNDDTTKELIEQSENGNLPLIILLSEAEEIPESTNILSLEGLTSATLNSAIAEGMKRHADGGFRESSIVTYMEKPKRLHADNEVPMEKIEGLRGYTLMRELGRGGMSRVYLAEDHKDGKEVAIKVLDMDTIEDDRMIERFIREYNMLGSVENIHVARILDQTFTDEYAFIIMERFEGGDLTTRIRNGIEPEDALDYVEQVAKGLSDVHKEGIVHRDLKPSNIMFRLNDTLAILDFGLAQMDTDEDLTKHGEVYGTPSYVSPEQARGRRVDSRSDIYSLGIIFYQMLTRKKPYRADNPMAMFYKHVHAEIPKFPAQYEKYQPLLEQMLAKSAEDRFQDAQALIDAIQNYKG